jgi:hypothetical protein
MCRRHIGASRRQIGWQYGGSAGAMLVSPTGVTARVIVIRWQYGASASDQWQYDASASDQAAVRCQRVGSGSSTMPASRRHIGTSRSRRIAGVSARSLSVRWQCDASVSGQMAVRCQRFSQSHRLES